MDLRRWRCRRHSLRHHRRRVERWRFGQCHLWINRHQPTPGRRDPNQQHRGDQRRRRQGIDPTPADNTASDTTPVTAAPDLTITKSDGDATTIPGGAVSYSLTITNVGNQGATGVTITDTVPAHATFNAALSTAGWSCANGDPAGTVCTFSYGNLAAGASGSVTFAVTVVTPLPSGVTQISNSASVADDGSNGADPTPGDNSSSDNTPVDATSDLAITKTDNGVTAIPGGTVSYTINYSNTGDQNATGVVITETVPTYTTFNAAARLRVGLARMAPLREPSALTPSAVWQQAHPAA